MSFGLPSIKVKPDVAREVDFEKDSYGMPNLMTNGFTSVKTSLERTHPLMVSERNYHKNRANLDMTMMRNTQGLHAPLKFAMECKAAKKIGHLPFLPSSNIMLDVLIGNDIDIGPEDIFNIPEFRETSGVPHAVVEKSVGIL